MGDLGMDRRLQSLPGRLLQPKEALDETQTESKISLIDTSGEKGSSGASREVEAIVE
jgi:hypothetical protein